MNLLCANCELLQQGIQLLSRHDDRTFNATDPASYGSGIGAHFRHVLDHYRSFLEGVSLGLIDYDNRERDTAEEKELSVALASLEEVARRMEVAAVDVETSVRVKVCASTEGDDLHSVSSFGRELQFLVSHTVHHYALIAIASRMQGIFPEDGFGVAPSTLKFLNSVQS
ncbi:DinB family protein [Pelagicoccus sp. NFK12]|uniref:DinB family protein n=1 Tax=Pelagicoccus enzymogenes TaxID=2773457 RepID=A0A927IFM1_9BACT|nr:DinB family protein [Pelagicoccus enzymogenes]MBD5780252.1 DinB family protein [Pelagicoccus enzymogenes]